MKLKPIAKPIQFKTGKKKKMSDIGAITTGAITALVGVALVSETTKLISKI